jgi:hypothetical protein
MGKITEINQLSNQILNKKYEILQIGNVCEIGRKFSNDVAIFSRCSRRFEGYAHRHKRRYYRLSPELLSNASETVKACNNCHDIIEYNPELSDLVFSILRPNSFIEPMVKITEKQKQKLTSKKPVWYFDHKCKACGKITSGIQCRNCGEVSV